MTTTEAPDTLLQRWSTLLSEEPGLRARNAAVRLGVSEGQLIAARCGKGVTRLTTDFKAILESLEALSEVLVITRNDHAVHEKRGFYRDLHLGEQMGMALDPNIDLRYNFRHWAHAFAVTETSRNGTRHSLQFFDRDGTSVHKIYTTANTVKPTWQALVERFADSDQTPGMTPTITVPDYPMEPREQVDAKGLRESWQALDDIHSFQPMLCRFKLRRLDAMRLVGSDLARPVAQHAWRETLERVAENGLPIMVFVGSPGVVQIHTGPIHKVLRKGEWFNVLDPTFDLHLRESAIAESWVVFRPTKDGGVTSLEFYGDNGELIGQLFGARRPGVPELKQWRNLLNEFPEDRQVTHHAG